MYQTVTKQHQNHAIQGKQHLLHSEILNKALGTIKV